MTSYTYDPNTLAFPPPEPYELRTCHPKPHLAPLAHSPREELGASDLPSLPSPARRSLLERWYTLSTHVVPAACPRTTPFLPLPEEPRWSPDKEEFKAAVGKTVRQVLGAKEAQYRGELEGLPRNTRPMWNCVNRYVRKGLGASESEGTVLADSSRTGVTLFFSHANGFPKEIWEPMAARLIEEYSRTANYQVDEVWMWEAANHGDSCILNKDALGGIFDWRDNSRDILKFLLNYLPAVASVEALPVHLPRLGDTEASSRRAHGFPGRKLLFVGHSFGACTLVRAAIDLPVLFKSLFLIEAMIRHVAPTTPITSPTIHRLVTGAVQRRDGWSSREEAHLAFATSPFFQAWDPAALNVYVECGLYDTLTGEVRLKMPGIQEAICFAEEHATHETFELLDSLDERVETRYLIAAKTPPEEILMRARVAWRRPANSSHVVIPSSGHLITQEDPSAVAKELHEHLRKTFGVAKALL